MPNTEAAMQDAAVQVFFAGMNHGQVKTLGANVWTFVQDMKGAIKTANEQKLLEHMKGTFQP
eukprot:8166847-Pyramimonas_sp.AAC.1